MYVRSLQRPKLTSYAPTINNGQLKKIGSATPSVFRKQKQSNDTIINELNIQMRKKNVVAVQSTQALFFLSVITS